MTLRKGLGAGMWCALAAAGGSSHADEAVTTPIEGAIGLVASYGPEYLGAGRYGSGLTPAGFLRWGRFSISGAGGFTTRRRGDVDRGLSARLVEHDRWRVSLGLRLDNGRSEQDSAAFAGMGDIDRTVRARLSLRYAVDEAWSLGASTSVDLLGQGGGWSAELGVGRDWRFGPVDRLQLRADLSFAGRRHLGTWYGVSAEQSAATGYPVYTPGSGLRDIGVALTWRHDFGPRWSSFFSVKAGQVLGPVADSPLVQRTHATSVGSGLVWRF